MRENKRPKIPIIIVAAPSGAGKSSFLDRICKEESRLYDTITYTTRPMRLGEQEGNPYHFVSQEKFKALIEENFFIEWAPVHTNYYGTPFYQLEEAWNQGKTVIMDVDVQGTETFKAKFPETKTIFILPPSIDELRRRISKRDGKLPGDFEVRMKNAENEMKEAPFFNYRVINDNFEIAYQEFKKIIEDLLGSL